MRRVLLVILSLVALVAIEQPLEAAAQARRTGNTRGSTRRAGQRRSRTRTRRSSSSRRRERRWYRRYRRRRLIVGVSYDPNECTSVRGGYCYYDDYIYTGASSLSFGFSLDLVGGLFPSDPNGLSDDRVVGNDVNAGLFGTVGGGVRAWLLYDRLRIGFITHSGGGYGSTRTQLPADGVFEAGSQTGDAWWIDVYGFAAYQPQLSDLISLYFGARAGLHTFSTGVEWSGRRYAALERVAFSAGPELGVMLSGGSVGVMLYAFADLAQPGVTQFTLAFVYEEPRPSGAAF